MTLNEALPITKNWFSLPTKDNLATHFVFGGFIGHRALKDDEWLDQGILLKWSSEVRICKFDCHVYIYRMRMGEYGPLWRVYICSRRHA